MENQPLTGRLYKSFFEKLLWNYGGVAVALFGMVFGFFWWNTFVSPSGGSYQILKGNTYWIEGDASYPQAYFRKSLYITSDVINAWVYLSAPDSYQLFINGEEITSRSVSSVNTTGIHDLTAQLVSGRNVIGVVVRRKTFPGSARLAFYGEYIDSTGQSHKFISDRSWKVSHVEEKQGIGGAHWNTVQFIDSEWNPVSVSDPVRRKELAFIDHPSEVMEVLPQGKWIWHEDSVAQSAYFKKAFIIDKRTSDVWIRIAADYGYELYINNIHVGGRQIFNKTYDLFNVTPFTHVGENTVGVGVTGKTSDHALLMDGLTRNDDGTQFIFSTDSTWLSTASTQINHDLIDSESLRWTTSIVLDDYPALPWWTLSKVRRNVVLSEHQVRNSNIKLFMVLMGWVLVFCVIWIVGAKWTHRLIGKSFERLLIYEAFLHLPSIVFLVFLYLMKFDVRYSASFPFQSKFVLMSILILIVLKVVFYLIEFKVYKNKTAEQSGDIKGEAKLKYYIGPLAVAVIVVMGFGVRVSDLDMQPLSHDEIDIVAIISK